MPYVPFLLALRTVMAYLRAESRSRGQPYDTTFVGGDHTQKPGFSVALVEVAAERF
jgi:hypothetical protein